MKLDTSEPRVTAASEASRIATELASRRTGLSFQRTRLSADRTLLSVIRTSLTLIGFGFTIFLFFTKLRQPDALPGGEYAARNLGTTLAALGIALLLLGIVDHVRFMIGLRATRDELTADGLIHGQTGFPASLTLVTAVLLLLTGLGVVISMVFRIGPFG